MSKIIFEVDVQMEEAVRKVAELTKEMDVQKKAVKTLKEFNMENSKEYVDAQKKIALLKDEIKGYNQVVGQTAKQQNAKSGSMAELSAQVALNKKAYRELSAEERENAEIGGKLLTTIQAQDAEIKRLDATIGNHQRNVGDYHKQLNVANMNLKEMQNELRNLRGLSFEGMNAEEIAEVKKQMAQLTEGIRDFREQTVAASESGIPGVVFGLQGIIAGAQGVIGSLGMAGVETEKLQKIMVQLIGVSQALATVEDAYSKGKFTQMKLTIADTYAKASHALATKAQTMATTGATVATRIFGKALMAIPLFAIIAGIIALGSGIAILVTQLNKETESARAARISTQALNKAHEEAYKQTSQSIVQTKLLVQTIQNEANSMELRKAKLKELNEMMGTNLSMTDNLTVATNQYIDSLMATKELEIVTTRMAELNAEMNNTYELTEKSKPSFWSFRTHLDSVTTGFEMLSEGITIFDEEAAEMYGKNYHQRWTDNITASQRDLKTEYETLFGRATDLIEGTTDAVEEHIMSVNALKNEFDEVYQATTDLVNKTTKKTEEINRKAIAGAKSRADAEKQAYDNQLKEARDYTASIIELGKSEEQKNFENYQKDLRQLDDHLNNKLISEQDYAAAKQVIEENWTMYVKQKQDEELMMQAQMNVLKALDDTELYRAKREQLEQSMDIELSMLEEGTTAYVLKHMEYLKQIEDLDKIQQDKNLKAQREFNQGLADLKMENYQTLDDLDLMRREKLEEQRLLDLDKERENLENGLITLEQYKMMEYEIEVNYAKKREDLERQTTERKIKEYGMFVNAAKGLSNSLMELEMQNAGESEAEKKRIKKKYANINAMISVGETAIATAQGMMGATAAMPGPAGLVLAALIGIMGAAQVALILSERAKIQGLATGGYVTRGGVFTVGERGQENVYLPTGAKVAPTGMDFGTAVPGVPDLNIPSGDGGMAEMMQNWQPIVTVEEINKVSNTFNSRVQVAEL